MTSDNDNWQIPHYVKELERIARCHERMATVISVVMVVLIFMIFAAINIKLAFMIALGLSISVAFLIWQWDGK